MTMRGDRDAGRDGGEGPEMLGSLSVLQRDEEARRGCVKGEARSRGYREPGSTRALTTP